MTHYVWAYKTDAESWQESAQEQEMFGHGGEPICFGRDPIMPARRFGIAQFDGEYVIAPVFWPGSILGQNLVHWLWSLEHVEG